MTHEVEETPRKFTTEKLSGTFASSINRPQIFENI